MQNIIEIFKMEEIPKKKRAMIIIKLGRAINHTYASNLTEAVVFELVSILDPDNEILSLDSYKNAK